MTLLYTEKLLEKFGKMVAIGKIVLLFLHIGFFKNFKKTIWTIYVQYTVYVEANAKRPF